MVFQERSLLRGLSLVGSFPKKPGGINLQIWGGFSKHELKTQGMLKIRRNVEMLHFKGGTLKTVRLLFCIFENILILLITLSC